MLNKQRFYCLALVKKYPPKNSRQLAIGASTNNVQSPLRYYAPFSQTINFATFCTSAVNQSSAYQADKMASNPEEAQNVYEFKVRNLDDEVIPMDRYKGQVLLIVNTAANCGLTKSNIKELKELHTKYNDQGVKILGFPSNDFKQELACDADIKQFVVKNGIEFDYFSKIHVNGDEADPLYKYLKAKKSGFLTKAIKWNFTKFLVDKNGIPIKRYSPTTTPTDIGKDIEVELKK